MKNYLYLFSFLAFILGGVFLSTGCSTDPASVPSFIRIDTIIVDSTSYDSVGSISSRVDFAWVYIDDNLQGVYKLPCKFPVIGEGVKNFRIFAGVYEFGNGSNATRYIFYSDWKTTDTLVVQDTLVFQPHVRYNIGLKIPNIQDFDSQFQSDFVPSTGNDGNFISSQPGGYEGLGGYMHLSGSETKCIIESATPINVPKGLSGYFFELNYKCNTPFYFDIKTSSGSRSIIGFNTKNTWNKAYINMTYAMDVTPGTDVKLIFSMFRDTSVVDQEVYLDNLKFIFKP